MNIMPIVRFIKIPIGIFWPSKSSLENWNLWSQFHFVINNNCTWTSASWRSSKWYRKMIAQKSFSAKIREVFEFTCETRRICVRIETTPWELPIQISFFVIKTWSRKNRKRCEMRSIISKFITKFIAQSTQKPHVCQVYDIIQLLVLGIFFASSTFFVNLLIWCLVLLRILFRKIFLSLIRHHCTCWIFENLINWLN
jgi:hypothetical protein